MGQAIQGTLFPSTNAGFYRFYDSTARLIILSLPLIESADSLLISSDNNLLLELTSTLTVQNGISVPTKTYGTRNVVIDIAGGLESTDYVYGQSSDAYAEIESKLENSAKLFKSIKDLELTVISPMVLRQ